MKDKIDMASITTESFHPDRIEARLSETLSRASHDAVKASLLTLIIVHNKENNSAVENLLDGLFGKRPLRIIRVESGFNTPTSIDVSARCFSGLMRGGICFEEIIVYNGPDKKGLDPGLWTPLILRDIPAAVFWFDKTACLPAVMKQADHFVDVCIVDSGELEKMGELPQDFFSFLYSYFIEEQKKERRVPLVDMGWRRILPLRQSTALLFDQDNLTPSLKEIESVSLNGFSESDMLLYTGWLAQQLEWRFVQRNGHEMIFITRDNNKIAVTTGKKTKAPHSVVITCRKTGSFSITCVDDHIAELTSPGTTNPHVMCKQNDSEHILHEIDTLHTDPLFYKIIEKINTFRIIEK
ncbi:MAG: glucose-6-phosphate dehydrogenase assembly protein OpcA [Spirochaetales bacterium]|nr:glucose-6-phosphate dehydrogenase assembly protein OpcA [Spirochaetales bacterium]